MLSGHGDVVCAQGLEDLFHLHVSAMLSGADYECTYISDNSGPAHCLHYSRRRNPCLMYVKMSIVNVLWYWRCSQVEDLSNITEIPQIQVWVMSLVSCGSRLDGEYFSQFVLETHFYDKLMLLIYGIKTTEIVALLIFSNEANFRSVFDRNWNVKHLHLSHDLHETAYLTGQHWYFSRKEMSSVYNPRST